MPPCIHKNLLGFEHVKIPHLDITKSLNVKTPIQNHNILSWLYGMQEAAVTFTVVLDNIRDIHPPSGKIYVS
jgi:hypothetical protein